MWQSPIPAAVFSTCVFTTAQAQTPPRPEPPRTVAPSYAVPPPQWIVGPERGSRLYVCPVPFSGHGFCPVPLLPYGTATPQAPPPNAAGAEQPPVGHIVLLVNPVGAEVSLDGVRLTQRSDLSYAVGVLEGRRVLRVAAPGFESHERVLDVQRGIGLFVTVRLSAADAEKKMP